MYGPSRAGLTNITLLSEDSDIASTDGAFKLLTFKDMIIRDLVWTELRKIAKYRYGNDDVSSIENFLNSIVNG